MPVALLLAFVIAGVVVTVLAWPGYQKFAHAVAHGQHIASTPGRARSSRRTSGWIWRNGTTLLLFGVDSKAGEPARSDTIMLMRFNPRTHTINQLSIPRDTRVAVAGQGYTKINEAMFWGGPSLAVKTVKQYPRHRREPRHGRQLQGVPAARRTRSAASTCTCPRPSPRSPARTDCTVTFNKGMHHFNGKYAMLYVRIRHADDDFHRAARQQAFVQALEKKIARPSNLTKLPEIGKRFMSGVATDLTTNQILELAYLKWRATGGKKAVMVGTPA